MTSVLAICMLRGTCPNDRSCLLCFGCVQLQAAGRAVDQRLDVYCPDNHFAPLTDTDADAHICMEFIRTNRAAHVNETGNL